MIDILEDIAEIFLGNKRLSSLKYFANQKGFSFRRRLDPHMLPEEVRRMGFRDGKKSKSLKGVLSKWLSELELEVTIFDYVHYHEFGNKTTTVYMYRCDDLDLPSFAVRPRGALGKLGTLFSGTEWSTVDRQFDRSFTVESEDMNKMRMTLTFQFAEEMLKLPGFALEGQGSYIVLYEMHEVIDIIDMDNHHAVALEIIDIIRDGE